ncbi:MAG TPA: pilus assembly protein TadG-related protein [Polyangia bacterium]|jgi:Flp pilus assembly protein TadG
MKQTRRSLPRRHPEQGTILILSAFFLPILFAFAAFAVDMGYRYTKSRMLQAVADSAVTVGMPSMVAHDTNAAATLATKMANANGYVGSTYLNVDSTATTGQLKVTVYATAPNFFASIFGGGSTRTLAGTAIGKVTSIPAPAMVALGGGCGTASLALSGEGHLTIDGDIESNGLMTISTGNINPQTDSGMIQTMCGAPTVWSSNIVYTGTGINPTIPASPFSDPFAADTAAVLGTYCTGGTSLTTAYSFPGSGSPWSATASPAGIYTLAAGVYCSSGDISLSGPGNGFIANGVTIISMGHVNVGADNIANGSVLTAAAGVPGGIAVYAAAGPGGPAINLGSNNLTVNGSVYAPNGLANLSGETGMKLFGSVVAQTLAIGIGDTSADWTFDPGGGTTSTTWRMYQ